MPKKSRLGKDPLSWVGDSRKESKQGKPIKQSKPGKPSKPDYQRATFHIKTEYIEKLKNESYWERQSLKELMDQILSAHFKGKKIKPRP